MKKNKNLVENLSRAKRKQIIKIFSVSAICLISCVAIITPLTILFTRNENNSSNLPIKPNPPNPDLGPIVPIPDFVDNPNNGGEEIKSNENEAIVNEWYRYIASRSVSINFLNNPSFPNFATGKGTSWILDYELTTDNSYPLKWYYSTNAHVANHLKNPNDYEPYAYNDPEGKNTYGIYFDSVRYRGDLLTGPLTLRVNFEDVSPYREYITKVPKTIFVGVDYLKSHPSKWNPIWQNEEIADIAILEVEFNDEAQARKVTYNYADLLENKKNKIVTTSLLTNQGSNFVDEFYVAGFPDIQSTPQFISNSIKQYPPNLGFPVVKNEGAPLAKFDYASTFKNTPGVLDNILGLPLINIPYHGIEYKLSGISYSFRYSALMAGSSGSMAINKDYEIIGNHFAAWNNTDVGLTMSYLSEGGVSHLNSRYYSEPYNLIYGGYDNQKNSYKKAMQKIYGLKPNTHLLSK